MNDASKPDGVSVPWNAEQSPESEMSRLIRDSCGSGARQGFRVVSDEARGHIFFDRGRIVHAEFGEDIGLRAVVEMLRTERVVSMPCTRRWPSELRLSLEPEVLLVACERTLEGGNARHETGVVRKLQEGSGAAAKLPLESPLLIEPPPLPVPPPSLPPPPEPPRSISPTAVPLAERVRLAPRPAEPANDPPASGSPTQKAVPASKPMTSKPPSNDPPTGEVAPARHPFARHPFAGPPAPRKPPDSKPLDSKPLDSKAVSAPLSTSRGTPAKAPAVSAPSPASRPTVGNAADASATTPSSTPPANDPPLAGKPPTSAAAPTEASSERAPRSPQVTTRRAPGTEAFGGAASPSELRLKRARRAPQHEVSRPPPETTPLGRRSELVAGGRPSRRDAHRLQPPGGQGVDSATDPSPPNPAFSGAPPSPRDSTTTMLRLSDRGVLLAARGTHVEQLADAAAFIHCVVKAMANDLGRHGSTSVHLSGGDRSLVVVKSKMSEVAAALGPTSRLDGILRKAGLS